MTANKIINYFDNLLQATLKSYSLLFFSNNNLFGFLVLAVTFFNVYAGLAGLVAALIAIITSQLIGFSKYQAASGFYSYNALLLGLGMGTFYNYNSGFWILLLLTSFASVLLSAVLKSMLGQKYLPSLSLAFIISFWLVILVSEEFSVLRLTERNIYWLNEMYATNGKAFFNFFQSVENMNIPGWMSGFFRSVSAILFQSNVLTGIILSAGLLIFSRIAFSLIVLGYACAILFIHLMGGNAAGYNYYNLGTNFMLVAVAVGGIYVIPSFRSYLWAIIMVAVSYVLIAGLGKITLSFGLPVYALPFCGTVILFVYGLQLRESGGKMVLTPVQYFSPEQNLYRYVNGKTRLNNLLYYHFSLPFMGEWMVSQGYDGAFTHKGDWAKALDFVVLDTEMKTYRMPGNKPEHFYCYSKPVLAPADGWVTEVINYVDDNEIGINNTQQNWGNSIIIQHAYGLYTKMSHLKRDSFTVKKGDFVKKGERLASCGNSGRSPEPHLHFQIQASPYVGSATIAYPLSYFKSKQNGTLEYKNIAVPEEGSFVSNIPPDIRLQQAFNFQPGRKFSVKADNYPPETWEVCVSTYNETYLYCIQKKAVAYFVNNGACFYFTNYFGSRNSLLYHFYMAAYNIILSAASPLPVQDNFPVNAMKAGPVKWLQDFIAPFYFFIHIKYQSLVKTAPEGLSIESVCTNASSKKNLQNAVIYLNENNSISFQIISNNNTSYAVCENL